MAKKLSLEEQRINDDKFRKYGILPHRDLIAAYTGEDNGTTLEYRQLVIAMYMLLMFFLCTAIESVFLWPSTLMPLYVLAYPVLSIGIFVFNSIVLKEEIGTISKYANIILVLVFAVVTFFTYGGVNGAATVGFIFIIAFTAVVVTKRWRLVMLLVDIVTFFACVLVQHLHPELIHYADANINNMLMILDSLKVGIFICVIVVVQTNTANKEFQRSKELGEELLANNETLIAVNEELALINENLRDTTEKLNNSLTSQKLFTASMNHELRAPLNGVMGGISLLYEADNLTRDQREIVEAANYSASNLLHIVNDLLDYAKIEAGEFEITKERFDLNEIIRALTMLNKTLAGEKDIDFIVNIKDGIATSLYGDGVRIQQVITNLLSNAIKYTHAGSVTLSIDVVDKHLKVMVKDTGEGISDEAKAVLFTPFKRINEGQHKAIQGTGLGLYVTERLVSQMEGQINVESSVGVGTTFTVDIPVEIVDTDDMNQNRPFTGKTDVDLTDKVFLCVDDNPINLRIFDKLVKKSVGAGIRLATSGEKALKVLEENEFDIIFLDSIMPDLSGEETLRKIREAGITTKAVVVTGETGKANEARFIKNGFDGYLEKPVDTQKLIDVVHRLLM